MILAIDTATHWTGLALHDGISVLAEYGWRSINTQTVELAPAIQEMLGRAGTGTDDLQAVAVALGPGSYTGLRIGLGLAKGIALAHQIPLIGVPTLDIVAAAQPRRNGQLIVVAAAGRRRISAGHYQWAERWGWQADALPVNTTWAELLADLEPPVTFAGEFDRGALKQIRGAGRGFQAVAPAQRVRRAGYLAEIAWRRLKRDDVDDPAALTPLYLREP